MGVQRTRQDHGRRGIAAPVAVHLGGAEAGHVVVLKQRGVVDHCVQSAHGRHSPWHQTGAGGFVVQVSGQHVGAGTAGAGFGARFFCGGQ